MSTALLETPVTQTSKIEAAEAAVKALMDKQAAESEQALKDSLDIRDPARERPPLNPPPESIPLQSSTISGTQPAKPSPRGDVAVTNSASGIQGTIPGANVIPEALLEKAAGIGLTAKEVETLGVDRVRQLVANYARVPEPEPAVPDFRFDPYTGQPMGQNESKEAQIERGLGKPKTKILNEQTGQEEEWDWDPSMREFADTTIKELQTTKQQLAQLQQREQARQQQAVARRDTRDFNVLENCFQQDEAFANVFGRGPAEKLIGTDAHTARHRVAKAVDALVSSGAAANIPEAYEIAKAGIYRQQVGQAAQAQVYDRARNAAGQFVARPSATDRADSEMPKGEARALKTLKHMLGER